MSRIPSVQAWEAATDCDSPDEARKHLSHLRELMRSKDSQIAALKAEGTRLLQEALAATRGLLAVVEVLTPDAEEPAINAARRVVAERDEMRGSMVQAARERDAAVADNAAKHAVIVRAEVEIQKRLEGGPWSEAGEAHLNALLTILQPAMLATQPGTALLEERKRDKDAIKALADAGEELLGGLVLLETDPARAVDAIAEASGRMIEALRLTGRMP